jgi:subtilisin-like proprotein convertase family protein
MSERGSLQGRRVTGVALALMLALAGTAFLAAGADAAKKKGKGAKTKVFAEQKAVNIPLPEGPAAGAAGTAVRSTITVPKKFKGLTVADVNVTGIKTTGSAAGAANDITARLTAPNGRTVILFTNKGDQSLGPWTLDDDTKVAICDQPSSGPIFCGDPLQSLYRPFAGTSNLTNNNSPYWLPLATLNGVPMKGTWTLTLADVSSAGATTSVLNSWGLRLTPAKAGAA